MLSRLQATVATAIDRLDDYDTTPPAARSTRSSTISRTGTCAARAAASGTATRAAFATLHECLITIAKLLAPFTPFVADELYENLDGSEPSVHLCDFPEPDPALRDEQLEWQMQVVARRRRARPRRARGQAQGRRCASRCARPSSSPPTASATRSSASTAWCSTS